MYKRALVAQLKSAGEETRALKRTRTHASV